MMTFQSVSRMRIAGGRWLRACALSLLLLPVFPRFALAAESVDALAVLRAGGHLAIMRHAIAPGNFDPPEFRLGDCSTQRNLSEEGRAQARKLGARLRSAGIDRARVYAGQWCRTRETAEQLGLGAVTELSLLNSFVSERSEEAQRTAALRQWIAAADLSLPVVLVTHQVNITGLSGIFPSSGEMIVLRRRADGGVEVAGRVLTNLEASR